MDNGYWISIDTDVRDKFEIALKLANETKDEVIVALIKSYVAQVFSQVASTYEKNIEASHNDNSFDVNYGKALHRIPKWARKPMQINYKIIRAYLQIAQTCDEVTYDALQYRCSNRDNYPDVYVPTFASNFAQMKFDGSKSHGKVFDVDSKGIVTIWDVVRKTVLDNKDEFLK